MALDFDFGLWSPHALIDGEPFWGKDRKAQIGRTLVAQGPNGSPRALGHARADNPGDVP